MFVQFISPGQFVAPFSLRLYVQDVGRADAFDKCALPKTNGYDNNTPWVYHSVAQIFATGHCVLSRVGDDVSRDIALLSHAGAIIRATR